jgi:hypothetical protein
VILGVFCQEFTIEETPMAPDESALSELLEVFGRFDLDQLLR